MSNVTNDEPEKTPPLYRRTAKWIADNSLGGMIGAVGVGLFFWWWNLAVPSLQFTDGEVIKFAGSTEADAYGMFVVTISNEGRRMAEQVKCQITLTECKIQDAQAGPLLLEPKVEISPDQRIATVACPALNAGESIEVAIKADSPSKIPQNRQISVRGKDATGTRKVKSSLRFYDYVLFPLFLMLTGLFFYRVYTLQRLEKRMEEIEKHGIQRTTMRVNALTADVRQETEKIRDKLTLLSDTLAKKTLELDKAEADVEKTRRDIINDKASAIDNDQPST